ncbi:MAG: nitroreductase family protein [Cellulosilyticaceae bacterium]
MNEVLHAIQSRRSIRQFKSDAIPEDMVSTILEAGFYAPTGHNKQPWHFVVINDAHTFEQIMAIHPYTIMLKTAPLAILVCADTSLSPTLWQDDCGAATQNMLLAAYSLGLGSVWCGVRNDPTLVDGFKNLFSLPQNITPYSLVVLGYTDVDKSAPNRFQTERIHYNTWDK